MTTTSCATSRTKTKPETRATDDIATTPTTTTATSAKTTKTTATTAPTGTTKQHHRMLAKMAATINSPQPKLQRTPVPLTSTMRWLSLSLLAAAAAVAVFTSSACEAASITTNHYNNNKNTADNDDDMALNYTRAWRLITRAEWGARPPASTSNFTGPAPYVILHHSYQPDVCRTTDACKASMRSMQNFHMDSHGWPDIGYGFAVGGDGNVYEARGYNVVGAHAPNYNSRSIGLLLIGNFVEEMPPAPMQQVAQDFIKYSTEAGHLHEDYVLHGHRQVRKTECPGAALYAEIQKWPHWQEV